MNHFKALKEKHMVCPECGHREFKWIPYRKAHQCCHCGKRISLRKNTICFTIFRYIYPSCI